MKRRGMVSDQMPVWLERSVLLLGENAVRRIMASTVAVVGVGGVGGYAAEMAVRSGVGNIILVDSDKVSETNLNRQIIALGSTLGKSKCEVMSERLKDINPGLNVTVVDSYLEDGKADELLSEFKIDFLVDAIDTLAPKLTLIKYCVDNSIPFVSSMGSGAKLDATAVRIADISKTKHCPLAYILRKKLRKMGINSGFKAVYSEELPDRDAIVECSERNKKSMVGTVSYLPAVFGCVCVQAMIEYFSKND